MAAVFKFKADGSQYARGLNQMRGQTQKFTTSVKGMVAGAFAGVSIAGFKNLLDNIVEMRRASERLGIGVEMFQKLSYAAKQTGADSERLADAIKDLDVKLQDGIMRGGSFAELIQELGMDMNELAAMSPDKRFLAFSDAIKNASGSLSRFGADEFGDAMFEMLPLLELGSDGILKLADDAKVMGDAQSAAAERASQMIDGTISNMIAQLSIWLANGLQMFEYFVTGATQAAIEIANVWKPLGKLIFAAMNPVSWATAGKAALKELTAAAEGAGGRISKAMDDILDKQLEAEKPKEQVGMTSAEKARLKAEMDAKKAAQKAAASEAEKNARSIAQSEATIAEEQEKRRQAALSDEEKIQDAIRKRIMLEEEYAAIDPFSDEVGKAAKGAELEKAKTKEQSLLQAQEEDLKQFYEGLEILDGKDADDDKTDPQTSIISSSLASVGGGGGTATFGNDPMLSESKKQSNLLEQLVSLQGGTIEGGGNLVVPEL